MQARRNGHNAFLERPSRPRYPCTYAIVSGDKVGVDVLRRLVIVHSRKNNTKRKGQSAAVSHLRHDADGRRTRRNVSLTASGCSGEC